MQLPQAIEEGAKGGKKDDILLSTQSPWMRIGSNLFFYDQFCGLPEEPLALNSSHEQKAWLPRILEAL